MFADDVNDNGPRIKCAGSSGPCVGGVGGALGFTGSIVTVVNICVGILSDPCPAELLEDDWLLSELENFIASINGPKLRFLSLAKVLERCLTLFDFRSCLHSMNLLYARSST